MRFGVATRPLPNLGIVRFLPIGPPAVRLLPRRFWMPIRVTGSQAAAGGTPFSAHYRFECHPRQGSSCVLRDAQEYANWVGNSEVVHLAAAR